MTDNLPESVCSAIVDAKDGRDQSDLSGECPYNACRLRDELRSRHIPAHVVRGGLDSPNHPTPETLKEAIEIGEVHWWVEARINNTWYTLDLASFTADRPGGTYVNINRPPEYIPFEVNPPDTGRFSERSAI